MRKVKVKDAGEDAGEGEGEGQRVISDQVIYNSQEERSTEGVLR